MTIQEFISKSFKSLHSQFPEAILMYQFDEGMDTHYIKVTPPDIYNQMAFAELGWEIKEKYNSFFDSGEICFLTDESLIQLSAPSRVLDPLQNVHFVVEANGANVSVIFADLGIEIDQVILEAKPAQPELNSQVTIGNYNYAMAA